MPSKRRSATSKQPSPGPVTFFADRNIASRNMIEHLAGAHITVQSHGDWFAPEAPDDDWIVEVARKGWVILTADKRIERDHLTVIKETRAKLVILTDNNGGWRQWAAALIVAHTRVAAILAAHDGPLIVRVGRTGEVSMVRTPEAVYAKELRRNTTNATRAKGS